MRRWGLGRRGRLPLRLRLDLPPAGLGANPVHPADVAEACCTALRRDDEADISVGGPDTMTRGEIVDLAIAAARREARVIHVPPTLLFALAVALRPVYPRMAEALDFITQAFTNDFVGRGPAAAACLTTSPGARPTNRPVTSRRGPR